MMTMRPALRLVDADGVVHEVDSHTADLEDKVAGLIVTVEKQSREIGRLTRKLDEFDSDNPANHPKGAEIAELVKRWKRGANKPTAIMGVGRVKAVKGRLKDGYPISSEEWLPDHPTLELAVDGLCAYPYRVYDRRYPTGKKTNLDNDLTAALKDEKHVEECARLGYQARKEGLITWGEA